MVISNWKQYWAPDTASYGYDSRAASIRIISAPGVKAGATRFEVRIPGADMNTHFAMSAIFGLGLRGITNKTALPYGPIGSPDVTRDTLVKLPTSLESATAAFMRKESIARKVFGDFFVDHYGGTREHELELNRRAVTDWESKCYRRKRVLTLHSAPIHGAGLRIVCLKARRMAKNVYLEHMMYM